MKKTIYLTVMGMLATASTFTSCLKDSCDDAPYVICPINQPNALVTVKPNEDNTAFRMQLTDDVVLWPVNMRKSPFGAKEVRAFVNLRQPTEKELGEGGIIADIPNVYVNWIDSIVTKPAVENLLGDEENRQKYGTDPIEIVDDWMTVAEDGYLTLRVRTRISGHKKHIVNLVHRSDVNTPYYFTLYHNAQGDTYGEVGDAVVAFKLPDMGPANGEREQMLTLEWQSYTGTKTVRFRFRASNTNTTNEELPSMSNQCFE